MQEFCKFFIVKKESGEELNIKGNTEEESRLIRETQKNLGVKADGIIGNATFADLVGRLCPEILPATLEMYGVPVIVGKDMIPFSPGGALSGYANTISGTFTYPRATTPCSIQFHENAGALCTSACHAWLDYPESVLYRTRSGEMGIKRVKSLREIKPSLRWAIGGVGLLGNYNPKAEGFCKIEQGGKTYDYSDVLRKTNHTVLGIKGDLVYGILFKNKTAAEINGYCRDKFQFDLAIMLDGGTDISAFNGVGIKQNANRKQGSAVQFI